MEKVDSSVWLSWSELIKATANRSVVFFGVADSWFKKTSEKVALDVIGVVDNSEMHQGSSVDVYTGAMVPVLSPDELSNKLKDAYVVITSGAYSSIVPQLKEMGKIPGKDFCCSPALLNLKIINDIHDYSAEVFLCSPDHHVYSSRDDDSDIGGGLYRYNLESMLAEKVFDGTIHQIIEVNNQYIVLDEMDGCKVLNKQTFAVEKTFGAEQGARSHGLDFSQERQEVYVGKTGLDKVSIYDSNSFEWKRDIYISEKIKRSGKEHHHMNDIKVVGDSILVSMFSFSGNVGLGMCDGGIMEIDLETETKSILVDGKWMPHSMSIVKGELAFLDSMRADLYHTDKKVLGTFSGFIRGLDFDGRFWFIGQSESRYFDRLDGIKNYISMTAGFYLFDSETSAGKFFQTPNIRQIRNLKVIRSEYKV